MDRALSAWPERLAAGLNRAGLLKKKGASFSLVAGDGGSPGAIFGLVGGEWRREAKSWHPDANSPKIAEDCEDCEDCTSPPPRNLRGTTGSRQTSTPARCAHFS